MIDATSQPLRHPLAKGPGLTLLLPRALLLMLESWLATISTLLAVMGMLVELSSPDRQLGVCICYNTSYHPSNL